MILVNPFPFLQLPYELRLNIYDHLLTKKQCLALNPSAIPGAGRQKLDLSLLRVSSQIHKEGSRVLYGSNTFFLKASGDGREEAIGVAYSMGKHNRALIKKLEVQVYAHSESGQKPSTLPTSPTSPHARELRLARGSSVLRAVADLLPKLEILTFLFAPEICTNASLGGEVIQRIIERSVSDAPEANFAGWDLSFVRDPMIEEMLTEFMESRGGFRKVESKHWTSWRPYGGKERYITE